MHVRASVTSSSCPGKPATPVADATVSMDCPQVIKASGASVLGKTDARGQFALDEPLLGRWLHDGCEIVIEKQGFEPERLPVASVCEAYSVNHCTNAVVSAELTPLRPCS